MKIKRKEKKRGKLHRTAKAQCRGRGLCDWGKKSSKAKLDFLVPIKSTTTTEVERKEKKKRKEKSKRIYRTSQKIRIISVFLESLPSESFPSLGVSPPYLPMMPSNTVLISGPAVEAAQILIWSYSVCSCLQCLQLSELVRFLLWALSMAFYIFHRHRVYLGDCVDIGGKNT